MKRILLTGMSGVGKSTITSELAARGYKAVDADCDAFSAWVTVGDGTGAPGSPVAGNRDWMWREDRIADLLATEDADILFVSGCAANMGKFLPRFDRVALLSAPADVIVARLRARPAGSYGSRPEEVARVLTLIEEVEPLLRRAANDEIDTSASLDEVIASLLALARAPR